MKRYAPGSTSTRRGSVQDDVVESIHDDVPATKRQRNASGEPHAMQLEQLLRSKKPSHDFNLLGIQEQQPLFDYLIGQYKHLRGYLELIEKQCPEADMAVVHNRGQFSLEAADTLLERPRTDWSYADDNFDKFEILDRIRWCSFDLCRPSASQKSLSLEVCTSRARRQTTATEKNFFLHKAISSQLLYYRLTVVFGMPDPVETDEYKTCWSVVLQFQDGTGRLELSDNKGAVWAAFCGSEDASEAALWFLGWIISNQVPHTYDGILAGCTA